MQSIALVPRGMQIDASEMARVASAIQIQLTRDFAPAWGIDAVCTAFPNVGSVPAGYLHVLVVPDAGGKAGFHGHVNGQPAFAVVQYAADGTWSVAASHEVIEMLVDPRGDRLVQGPDPINAHGRVHYLMEICDPCQGQPFSYQVDHNHSAAVADFCLPSFYGLGSAGPPYSKRGNVPTSFSVSNGGVLSYRTSDSKWFQLQAVGGPTRIVQVDPDALFGASGDDIHNFRGALDRHVKRYLGPPVKAPKGVGARRYAAIRELARVKAAQQCEALRARLDALGLVE